LLYILERERERERERKQKENEFDIYLRREVILLKDE
jgi:hypothetical protein